MNNTEILISLSKIELQNINGGEVPRAYISSLVLNCATIWSMVIRAIIGALPFFFAAFRFTKSKTLKVLLIISIFLVTKLL